MLSSDEGEPCDASQCPSSPDKKLVCVGAAEVEEPPAQQDKPQETCSDVQVWQNTRDGEGCWDERLNASWETLNLKARLFLLVLASTTRWRQYVKKQYSCCLSVFLMDKCLTFILWVSFNTLILLSPAAV